MLISILSYKSSNIFIIDINHGGQILQKLRGHDGEIHGVVWCPTLGEELYNQENEQGKIVTNRNNKIFVYSKL